MKTPTVHLNGTSRDALVAQYTNARVKLHDAIMAVQASAPNGRDYYPQSNEAIFVAQDEHTARLKALDLIYNEITALLESVLPEA